MNNTFLAIMLKDLVILPLQEIKLELKDENSKKIIRLCEKKYKSRVLVVSPSSKIESPTITDLPPVGVVAFIKSKIDLSNGNVRVTLKGERRVKILAYRAFSKEIIDALVTDIVLPKYEPVEEEVIRKKLVETLNEYINSDASISNSILKTVNDSYDLNFLTDVITSFLPLKFEKKLYYMLELNSEKRAISLIKDIKVEIKYLGLEEKIDNEVQINLTKDQEEFYLREKLKEIEKKLGVKDNDEDDLDSYAEKLNSLNLDNKIINKINIEMNKLKKTPVNSPEYSVIRNYLDWILSLPWNNKSKENLNCKRVINALNRSHFGLIEVKEKIEDYINGKNINNSITSPIICLVGPPGVGKTTITESIASALNREFYKISVGGLNDSVELVGSRRTYLGALPGKIIQGLRKCGTKNPVILIDEVDKLVHDYKGDPASSLLDILDATQNKNFTDNYIEEPFDLSEVLFILTANNAADIPYTLYDRLDIIELSSYTVFEKVDIAKKYILPRIYKELNISKKLVMKDETLEFIINNYTKEAGVRNLSRILKRLVIKVMIDKKRSMNINNKDIVKYLKEPINSNSIRDITLPGVVNALAYTPLGGCVLKVECAIYNGEEKICITGSLGEVLKESIFVATSFIKEKGYVNSELFNNHTIHIHLLDGATKKEGPSCGVAIVTAIISKLLNINISNKVAFTGELTLKGDILKIGGLKEKLIAAYNDGIETIYIPEENNLDLKEIPKQILDKIKIKLVNNYDAIYKDMFKKEK
jgi:ATP-dependent Lon protease